MHFPLARLAVRNIARRPGEAALVVLGSLLGTAIICASFVVGDTLDASIRDLARTQLGPIDEIVSAAGADALPELEALVADPPSGTDGTLPMVSSSASIATVGDGARVAEPEAIVHEVDFDDAARFGGDPTATGFAAAPPEPREGEVVLGVDLARTLDVGVGDSVEVFAFGTSQTFDVTGTLPRLGVAGFSPEPGADSPVAFVAPGTLARLAAPTSDSTARPPTARVLVSNAGGVFGGAAAADRVADELLQRAAGRSGVRVETAKADVLEEADAQGESFTQLFASVGGFSVIAGVLLLVNIFVMLAEERKRELGMLRAIGFKRHHLVRTFGIEGAIYALVAAAVGAVVGIGVGRVIAFVTSGLFDRGDVGLALRFAAEPESVVTAGLVGFGIGLVTVWATSVRIGRLNVIRAIRDVPEPTHRRHRIRTLLLALAGVVLGALLFSFGASNDEPFPALAGPAVALWSLVPLLTSVLPRRVAIAVPNILALAWAVLAFVVFDDLFDNADVALFVVQGVILVASAVAVASAVTDRLSARRRGVATRLGLAYPLARRFRTALLLGMYSLVVFTLTFLSVLAGILQARAPTLTAETSAGYDVLVDSSPGNPVAARQLQAEDGVDGVAGLRPGVAEFATQQTFAEPKGWALTGFDESLLERGAPALDERDPAFPTDEAAWRAALDDPSLAFVSGFFLNEGAGPPQDRYDPGDQIAVINSATGEAHPLTIAGIVTADFQFNGALVTDEFVEPFLGPLAAPTRWYVGVEPGADPDAVAARLTGDLLANGVDAQSFRDLVDERLAQQNGFFRLMQGFLSLGLLIGIAGLGVVMVRAVRERRRQIGMLRAMGFPSRVVRRAFLLEATFIAAQGIVIGVALGLVTSWSLLVNSSVFGGEDLAFEVPWIPLVFVVAGPLGASLLAASIPASRAAAIQPAVALRIAD